MNITKELAAKVLNVVDQGLVSGMGEPVPGQMCVEAAVCYAMGLPHSDQPTCVGEAVRRFKISLNDARWPSDEARTKGMRKLAVAQLGSESIDQRAFADYVVVETIKRLLPLTLRHAGESNQKHAVALEEVAQACEKATRETAYELAVAAKKVSALARKDASADAAAYAADAAYASAAKSKQLQYLTLAAEIGLEALIVCKSPGVEYLFLCEESA